MIFMTGLIVIQYILCIFVGAGMATKQNRSEFGWAVASFFFGIFAIFTLMMIGDKK